METKNIGLSFDSISIFERSDYLEIIDKLTLNKRSNIVEVIKIISKNKDKFREANLLDRYNKILTNLFKLLENTKPELELVSVEKLLEMIGQIKNFKDLFQNPNKSSILQHFPLLKYCFGESKDNKYQIQIAPITGKNYKLSDVVLVIKFFLKIMDDSGTKKNRIFISLSIYDFIFRNFKLIETNKKFAITCYKKLLEFISDENLYEYMKSILDEYGYDINTYELWKNVFEAQVDINEV